MKVSLKDNWLDSHRGRKAKGENRVLTSLTFQLIGSFPIFMDNQIYLIT
jgi:hypothetical protein